MVRSARILKSDWLHYEHNGHREFGDNGEEESSWMLLWWGSMRQERSSTNIGQESSKDDCERQADVWCGKVEGLVYLRFALRLVLRKTNFARI